MAKWSNPTIKGGLPIELKRITLRGVPQPYRRPIRAVCERILNRYDDVAAIVLIGSVAEGDFVPESDVDILCIRREKTPWEEQQEIVEGLDDRIQCIFFTEEMFQSHLKQRTTMAHSVLRGVTLYEAEDSIGELSNVTPEGGDLDLPDREWMKRWFVHWLEFYEFGMKDVERSKERHLKHCTEEKCHCWIEDSLARSAVNMGILFLETKGIVPTTKRQIERHFRNQVEDGDLRTGLVLALRVSREERVMNYNEAQSVAHVAGWLRDRLIETLQPTAEDLECIVKLKEILCLHSPTAI